MRGVIRLLTLLVFVGLAAPGAQDDNRIGLVVDYGDGRTATRCVAFAEPDISGFEALSRSGLVVETDIQAGGAAVCRIDDVGCAVDDCFCACRGGDDCRYWSYWQLRDGAWRYAAAGSAQQRVSDGAVEGWTWGLGTVTQAAPPPLASFDAICSGATVSAAPEAEPPVDWRSYALFGVGLVLLASVALLGRARSRRAA